MAVKASVAQLVERWPRDSEGASSIPSRRPGVAFIAVGTG